MSKLDEFNRDTEVQPKLVTKTSREYFYELITKLEISVNENRSHYRKKKQRGGFHLLRPRKCQKTPVLTRKSPKRSNRNSLT